MKSDTPPWILLCILTTILVIGAWLIYKNYRVKNNLVNSIRVVTPQPAYSLLRFLIAPLVLLSSAFLLLFYTGSQTFSFMTMTEARSDSTLRKQDSLLNEVLLLKNILSKESKGISNRMQQSNDSQTIQLAALVKNASFGKGNIKEQRGLGKSHSDSIKYGGMRDIISSVTSSNQIQTEILQTKIANLEKVLKETTSIKVNVKPNALAHFSFLLKVLALLFLGIALLIPKYRKPLIWTAIVTMTAHLSLEIKFELKPEFKLELNPEIKICKCDSAKSAGKLLTQTIQVGSFKPGFDELVNDSVLVAKSKLIELISGKSIFEIHVFGGADPRTPKRKSKNKFGDNVSLCQARAIKIKYYISELFKDSLNKPNIITHVKGAEYYSDSGYNEHIYEASRRATIEVLYVQK